MRQNETILIVLGLLSADLLSLVMKDVKLVDLVSTAVYLIGQNFGGLKFSAPIRNFGSFVCQKMPKKFYQFNVLTRV